MIKSLLERHKARKAEAKLSMANVRLIRSAESPMFEGLMRITGATEEEAKNNRRNALNSVINSAR